MPPWLVVPAAPPRPPAPAVPAVPDAPAAPAVPAVPVVPDPPVAPIVPAAPRVLDAPPAPVLPPVPPQPAAIKSSQAFACIHLSPVRRTRRVTARRLYAAAASEHDRHVDLHDLVVRGAERLVDHLRVRDPGAQPGRAELEVEAGADREADRVHVRG